jgi:hypothetical protein
VTTSKMEARRVCPLRAPAHQSPGLAAPELRISSDLGQGAEASPIRSPVQS